MPLTFDQMLRGNAGRRTMVMAVVALVSVVCVAADAATAYRQPSAAAGALSEIYRFSHRDHVLFVFPNGTVEARTLGDGIEKSNVAWVRDTGGHLLRSSVVSGPALNTDSTTIHLGASSDPTIDANPFARPFSSQRQDLYYTIADGSRGSRFASLSWLLQAAHTNIHGTDISASSHVKVFHLNGTSGEDVEGEAPLVPLLHVVRHDVSISVKKMGEFEWTMNVGFVKLSSHPSWSTMVDADSKMRGDELLELMRARASKQPGVVATPLFVNVSDDDSSTTELVLSVFGQPSVQIATLKPHSPKPVAAFYWRGNRVENIDIVRHGRAFAQPLFIGGQETIGVISSDSDLPALAGGGRSMDVLPSSDGQGQIRTDTNSANPMERGDVHPSAWQESLPDQELEWRRRSAEAIEHSQLSHFQAIRAWMRWAGVTWVTVNVITGIVAMFLAGFGIMGRNRLRAAWEQVDELYEALRRKTNEKAPSTAPNSTRLNPSYPDNGCSPIGTPQLLEKDELQLPPSATSIEAMMDPSRSLSRMPLQDTEIGDGPVFPDDEGTVDGESRATTAPCSISSSPHRPVVKKAVSLEQIEAVPPATGGIGSDSPASPISPAVTAGKRKPGPKPSSRPAVPVVLSYDSTDGGESDSVAGATCGTTTSFNAYEEEEEAQVVAPAAQAEAHEEDAGVGSGEDDVEDEEVEEAGGQTDDPLPAAEPSETEDIAARQRFAEAQLGYGDDDDDDGDPSSLTPATSDSTTTTGPREHEDTQAFRPDTSPGGQSDLTISSPVSPVGKMLPSPLPSKKSRNKLAHVPDALKYPGEDDSMSTTSDATQLSDVAHGIPKSASHDSAGTEGGGGGREWWQRGAADDGSEASYPQTPVTATGASPPRRAASRSTLKREYEVLECVGRGGGGAVFKSRHHLTGSLFAIKIILLRGEMEEKAMREAVVHANLDHKNVVRFYHCWTDEIAVDDAIDMGLLGGGISRQDSSDSLVSDSMVSISNAGEDSLASSCILSASYNQMRSKGIKFKALFLQMEYFSEGTLFDYMTSRDFIDPVENAFILLQITRGLEYMHSKNTIHRDLKPTNIFVADELSVIKIGDFGLSAMTLYPQELTIDREYGTQGAETHCAGSPMYSSPEQRDGRKVTSASDVFSLGMLAFELYQQFDTMHERGALMDAFRERHVPAQMTKDHPALSELLLSMTHNDPRMRPPLSAVLTQLKTIQKQVTGRAQPDESPNVALAERKSTPLET